MLLPDDLIAKLAECSRANFVGIRDIWFGRLSLSTWTVAFGLLLELPELVYELKSVARERIRWFKHRTVVLEKRMQLAKVTAFIGWFLIVAGVVGEGYAGIKINNLDASIQGCSDAKVREATLEAGEARDSTAIAKASEEALEKKADALTLRLEGASRQLGQLEEDIRAQGPRWRLIERAAPELVKALLPFAGQKVALYVCTSLELRMQEGEMMNTWGRIADVLADKGAKWSMPYSNLRFWKSDFSCDGIQVGFSSRAPKRTKEAAKALSDALFNVLPPSVDNQSGATDPDFVLSMLKRGLEREDAPWVLTAKNPELIVVMIARHPQRELLSKSKMHKWPVDAKRHQYRILIPRQAKVTLTAQLAISQR